MKLWLQKFVLSLAANVVVLLIAAIVLERFTIRVVPFIIAALVFTVLTMVLRPVADRMTAEHAKGLIFVSGLATTAVALVLTDIFSRGVSISGFLTWILAILIVWIGTVVYALVDDKILARVNRPSAPTG